MAGDFHVDRVQARASGHVERLVSGAAEGRVRGLFGEGDHAQRLARRTEHLQPKGGCDVQIALNVDGQAVAAAIAGGLALGQFAEDAAFAELPWSQDGIRVHLFLHARNDIQRLFIRREDDAVGRREVFAEPRDFAIVGEVVKRLFRLGQRHRSAEPRIGEVDATGLVQHQVVRSVEPLALVTVGQRLHLLGGDVDFDQPAIHFAGDDVALGVEHQPVGVLGWFEEHGHRARRIHLVNPLGRNIAEVQVARAVGRRPFGELQVSVQLSNRALRTESRDRRRISRCRPPSSRPVAVE